jgi:AraC-like DNA-binding protein
MAGDLLVLPGGGWVGHAPGGSYRSIGFGLNRLGLNWWVRRVEASDRAWQMLEPLAHWCGSRACDDASALVRDWRRLSEEAMPASIARHLAVVVLWRMGALVRGGVTGGKAAASFHEMREWLLGQWRDPPSREQCAVQFGLSPTHVSRLFARFSGGYADFLVHLRLERARAAVATHEGTVATLGQLCGFSDANYFIRRYRRRFGETPGIALRRARRTDDGSRRR